MNNTTTYQVSPKNIKRNEAVDFVDMQGTKITTLVKDENSPYEGVLIGLNEDEFDEWKQKRKYFLHNGKMFLNTDR